MGHIVERPGSSLFSLFLSSSKFFLVIFQAEEGKEDIEMNSVGQGRFFLRWAEVEVLLQSLGNALFTNWCLSRQVCLDF